MFVLSWVGFWFLCFWDSAFVGWGSSTQTEQLSVWGARAELEARVDRPRAVLFPTRCLG